MKAIPVSDIWLRTQHGQTLIPGGWTVPVPEVRPVDADLRVLRMAMLDDYAGDAVRAERRVLADVANEFAQAHIRNVRFSVAGYARKFARRFPKKVKRRDGYVELSGFDPTRVAALYWAGLNTGRRGNPWADQLLREMGGVA